MTRLTGPRGSCLLAWDLAREWTESPTPFGLLARLASRWRDRVLRQADVGIPTSRPSLCRYVPEAIYEADALTEVNGVEVPPHSNRGPRGDQYSLAVGLDPATAIPRCLGFKALAKKRDSPHKPGGSDAHTTRSS